jgi:cytochrome c-type biogenesis protein CcmH
VRLRNRGRQSGAIVLVTCLLFGHGVCSAAAEPLTPEQDERYTTLIHELRCLVCQNQTIADSNAPLAADLRDQVRKRILLGESNTEIRNFLTDRYGDFVLYKPPLRTRTVLLWFGPFVLLLLAIAAVMRYARRSRAARAPATVDEQALRRILDDAE